jgi:hypothetical protein
VGERARGVRAPARERVPRRGGARARVRARPVEAGGRARAGASAAGRGADEGCAAAARPVGWCGE